MLSKIPSGPLAVVPLVTTCIVVSGFVQVTVSPGFIDTLFGMKHPLNFSQPGTEEPGAFCIVTVVSGTANAFGIIKIPTEQTTKTKRRRYFIPLSLDGSTTLRTNF